MHLTNEIVSMSLHVHANKMTINPASDDDASNIKAARIQLAKILDV